MNEQGTENDQYFEWLYGKVASIRNRNPRRSHWKLTRQMFITPFSWTVPNDDNRVMDGLELRYKWMQEKRVDQVDRHWLDLECSFLEMLIALSERASFESYGTPADWFWHFVKVMELRDYSDDIYEIAIQEEVDETLERIIKRTYLPNGDGGLFPLTAAEQDQRDVELWYQLAAYLLEGEYVTNGPNA